MTTSIAQPGDDARPEPLRFLGNPLPAWVRRRVVTIAPGHVRPFDEAEWRDALVIVQVGEVALECTRGGRTTFRAGDVLWLVDIPVVRICNDGSIPAVIVAVSRRPVRPQAEQHDRGRLSQDELERIDRKADRILDDE